MQLARVGFILGQVGWTGGVNYYRNLLAALQVLPDKKVEPVIFAGLKSDITAFDGLAEVVRTPLLDRHSFSWWMNKLSGRLFFGREYLLYRLLRDYQIDLLSHSSLLWRGCLIPSLGWIPDFQHLRLPDFFSEKAYNEHNKLIIDIIHRSDALLLSSQDALDDLKQFDSGDLPPTYILRFVSCLNSYNEDLPTCRELVDRYGLGAQWFHLPNQFWAHKNHDVVIQSLLLLKKEGNCPLVVSTGDIKDYRNPDYFPALMKKVRDYGLQDNFLVLGMVPYKDVVALMRESVAVINPSLFEGWSTSVEEAKAMGKSIILSDIPVHREQNPERAVFFDSGRPEKLAEGMTQVIQQFNASEEYRYQESARSGLVEKRDGFAKAYEEIVFRLCK